MSASPPYMEKVTARGERGIGTGYGRFIAAVATSFYGDWFTTVALLVAVYQLSPGPVAPALFTLVRLAPRLVASTPGGHLADRVNPGLLTALTSAVQATATLALVAAVTAGSLPLIYVLVAVSSFLGALARATNDIRKKGGDVHALVAANPDLKEKLQRASVKVLLSQHLFDPPKGRPFGYQDPNEWNAFAKFMQQASLIHSPDAGGAFTNALLPGQGP